MRDLHVEAPLAIKRDYLVTRPFVAIDRSGNSITIHSREVSAYLAQDQWIRGEASGRSFGVLESVFAEVAIPKCPPTAGESAAPNDSVGWSGSSPSPGDGSVKLPPRCPKCASDNTRPSNRKTRSLIKAMWTRPYRCQSCDERFHCARWKR
jgi:hypothetical protein